MHVGFLKFEEVLRQPDPREDLQRLVDPRLGDDYPIDSVRKVMCNLIPGCKYIWTNNHSTN